MVMPPNAKQAASWAWGVKSVALWYACIVLFANGFVLRGALLEHFGRAYVDNIGPVLTAVAAVAGLAWTLRSFRRWPDRRMALAWFAAAAVLAVAGLMSADPAFPAKRVHVPEYALLACLVFTGFKGEGTLGTRAVMAVIITAMLGGLEEVLQGVMADRTYGVADMLTNALGAAAGILAVLGVVSARARPMLGEAQASWSWRGNSAPLALAAGYALCLLALYPYRGLAFPLWVVLPVLGGLVVLLRPEDTAPEALTARFRLAVGVIALTALGGLGYVQVLDIRFS